MKTTFLFLLVAMTTFGQNLIVDSNITIGQNCGQGQPQEVVTYQDINFNGVYTVNLKNVKLIITGNQNGTGIIKNQCNNAPSQICIAGNQNGSITYDGVTLVDCSLLSTPVFNENINVDLPYVVYDLTGRLIDSGMTNPNMLETLQSNTVYLIKVEGFELVKRVK